MHKIDSVDWNRRFERALALLSSRLDDPPALDELASAAAVSPYHFHRLWRAMCGEPIGQTIARLRIALSQDRLLREPSVTAAAIDGGFASSQSFARAFRRVTGTTPSQFLAAGGESIGIAAPVDASVRIEWRAPANLVALRQDGGAYRNLNALYHQLWDWAERAGKLDGLTGLYGIPLDDPISVDEQSLRYEAALAFDDPGRPPAPFHIVVLPAADHAVLRHVGSYDSLEASDQAMVDWLIRSPRTAADFPLFHLFLDDPEEVPAEALRTDILLRLQPENDQ